MNLRAILRVLGMLLLVTSGSMILPVGWSLLGDRSDLLALLVAAVISAAVGFPLWWLNRDRPEFEAKDAYLIAVLGWVVISAFSAIPFLIHGAIPSFTDAFFEMMSGYTTTGATILTDIEAVPRGLLLWRSETHMLGGMGFLTLVVVFLPHGMGGVRIFRAEASPGQVITGEKFTPRNRDAVVYLWIIYLGLNAAEVLLLTAGGMSLFDALCHAFGTISTGGYSSYNASAGHFDSFYVEAIITLFMFLGGVTFMLYYQLVRGRWQQVVRNTELRWYLLLVGGFIAAVTLVLWSRGTYGFVDAVRYGGFQVVSLLSTTGFATADYEQWPHAAQMFLYVVCFIGACAGSTTSGIKLIHYIIIWKFMVGAIKKMFIQPLAVLSVRVDRRPVPPTIIYLAVCYFIVNIFLVLGGGIVMALLDDMDVQTAMSSVIASLMNIGPGFGAVGPTENYAFISSAGKWFLGWLMLVGRLDMFSALVLLYPSFWRR